MSHNARSFHSAEVGGRIADTWGVERGVVETWLAAATLRHCPRGQAIYPQGTHRSSLFAVLDGVVSMSVRLPSGQRILCSLYQPGALFGFPIGERERPRWSAADAFTPVTVAVVPRREFERALNAQPPAVVTGFFNRVLERQARFAMRLVYCIALDLRGRLALTLLDLAAAFGVKQREGVSVQLPITHENLADMVGASRERTSRAMAALMREGAIRYSRQAVTLVDLPALKAAATPAG